MLEHEPSPIDRLLAAATAPIRIVALELAATAALLEVPVVLMRALVDETAAPIAPATCYALRRCVVAPLSSANRSRPA